MKITREDGVKQFTPITLHITITSQDEYDALRALTSCETSTSYHVAEQIAARHIIDRLPFNRDVLTDILKMVKRTL